VILRLILLSASFAALLPFSAQAQLQLFEFDGTNDTPVGTVLIIAAAAPGDIVVTRFHVRDTGSGPAVIQIVSVAGAGFTIQSAPSIPYTLAPYTGAASEAEIDVAFSPASVAPYSASLVINSTSFILQGTVASAAVLSLAGSNTPISSGATVNFGSVAPGSPVMQGLILTNSSNATITVATITVTGADFTGPIGLTAPVQLTPGETAMFQISFAPQSGTSAQGVLTVGQQTFNLTGQGTGSPAPAQLQIFQIVGTTDTPVGALVNVGTAALGDTVTTRFHVRNTGAGPATLQTISLAGDGFTILSSPPVPYTLSPYVGAASEAEIDVTFTPTIAASYSAALLINTTSITLLGAASSSSAVVTVGTSTTPLTAGATVNFGSVDVGSEQVESFLLSNPSNAGITVASVAVSGTGFTLSALTLPAQIGSGQSLPFQVTFTPQSGTVAEGTLTVDTRTFNLEGQGLAPLLPAASIAFTSTVGASGQQNSISIPLAKVSEANGTGTLTLAFQSSVTGVSDDPAIQFLSGPLRIATVTVSPGDTSATIGGQSSIAFQTGTTAGTIKFTLALNNTTQQATLTIPPTMINLDEDTFSAVRLYGSLNVAFGGFDNTYSASQLAFTFYDLTGKELPQGAINVSAASAFKQYFNTTQAGGLFQVLAEFPVTGSTTLIGYVTAQITNSLGASTAQLIPFGN